MNVTLLTYIIGIVIIIGSIGYSIKNKRVGKLIPIIIITVALSFSLITSYEIIQNATKITISTVVLNAWVVFGLNVLIKFLICYWIIELSYNILYSDRIIEHSTKAFGVEKSVKYKEKADMIVQNAKKAEEQFDLIVYLTRNIYNLLIKPFEDIILTSDNPIESIRQLVKDVLQNSYTGIEALKEVKIYVIPLNQEGYDLLNDHLASKVRILAIEGKPINEIKKEEDMIGIAVIPGFDENGTAIIIDATAPKYPVSDAELSSASTLFVSLVQIIDCANNARQEVEEKV